jgi:hypothetical protein
MALFILSTIYLKQTCTKYTVKQISIHIIGDIQQQMRERERERERERFPI